MKFLVLALCVCAANAAYKPWQPVQPVRQVANAFAQVAGYTPEAAYKGAVKPFAKAVTAPAAVANAVASAPVVAAKTAVYASQEAGAAILRYDNDITADGFNNAYETSNGIAAQSSGTLKQGADKTEFLAFQGGYKYIAPDGTPVEISYVADENGYQPQGASLPVGPPTPDYILRALEYINAHPSKDNY